MQRRTIRKIIVLIVMTLLLFGVCVGEKLVKTYQLNGLEGPGTFSIQAVLILQFILYFIAGMIFGMEKLLSERKKIGRWRIGLTRLILVGVPTFLMGILTILTITFSFIPELLSLSFVNFNLFVNFMQMVFGYVIITSFYKDEEVQLTNK